LEICQLAVATLSIVAVAPFFHLATLITFVDIWRWCGPFRQVIITHHSPLVCTGQNGGSEAYGPWGASAQKLKLMMFEISLGGLLKEME